MTTAALPTFAFHTDAVGVPGRLACAAFVARLTLAALPALAITFVTQVSESVRFLIEELTELLKQFCTLSGVLRQLKLTVLCQTFEQILKFFRSVLERACFLKFFKRLGRVLLESLERVD